MINLIEKSKLIINEFIESEFESIAVEIESDSGNYTDSINGHVQHHAASLLKVPLAMAVENEIKCKNINERSKIAISELLEFASQNSVLKGLVDTRNMSIREVINLSIISSDESCARYLRSIISTGAIADLLLDIDCLETEIYPNESRYSINGKTTALDALKFIKYGSNLKKYPILSNALANSITNSRIPIGVDKKFSVQHKTGTLMGLAHDVAEIKGSAGILRIACLTSRQSDLIISGLRMGLCVNQLLSTWDLSASSTISIL